MNLRFLFLIQYRTPKLALLAVHVHIGCRCRACLDKSGQTFQFVATMKDIYTNLYTADVTATVMDMVQCPSMGTAETCVNVH